MLLCLNNQSRIFQNFKADYQSKKKQCQDKTLHSSTLLLNDILPGFETWQGKTTREKETFSHLALFRMEQFLNKVILHLGHGNFYNFSHKTVEMQNFK